MIIKFVREWILFYILVKERGETVVELDGYKQTLLSYESPLQEVRDSL